MKRSLLTLSFLFLYFSGYGQITLLDTDYPSSLLGTDSLKKTTYSSSFFSIPTLSGGFCDFTYFVDTSIIDLKYRLPYVSCSYADSFTSPFFLFSLRGKNLATLFSSQLIYNSSYVDDTHFSLFSITSGFFDSLYISGQNAVYSSPRKIIAFPASVGSSWGSDYNYDLNFELTVAAFSLDHDPGFQRRYTTETNNVIGWGRVRVNDITGVPSPYFDVLQVQTETRTVDSFFLDGAPMSPVLLGIFNLVQGKKDTTFEYNYYRKGEVTPLVKIEFKDAAYTQPFRGTTHVQRIYTNAVAETEVPKFSVYPNPVSGGLIHVQVPVRAGDCTYQLTDVDGRIEASGKLSATNGCASIPLSKIPTGMYLLKVGAGSHTYNTCVQVN